MILLVFECQVQNESGSVCRNFSSNFQFSGHFVSHTKRYPRMFLAIRKCSIANRAILFTSIIVSLSLSILDVFCTLACRMYLNGMEVPPCSFICWCIHIYSYLHGSCVDSNAKYNCFHSQRHAVNLRQIYYKGRSSFAFISIMNDARISGSNTDIGHLEQTRAQRCFTIHFVLFGIFPSIHFLYWVVVLVVGTTTYKALGNHHRTKDIYRDFIAPWEKLFWIEHGILVYE